ncbi:Egd1p KNAG_0A02270 [Huiozyma naganishii CBS 8797]|uniref:NAC-A/B domain-containing protein n=1 Tax=Huiozyma naganishii (strain ATCC MYA-139 / BCRC 22969 / CBS 8797 / KCTC 17520 / NBRC 10181 / NCYC 3082 / Yp74L-3) TaxID=1071383 RepID=J7S3C3_HUIN7|nr:hypothetical protein KNAG_0A02270 [Kazachstania naganishii CBS 8797]CCK67916.1 hypothetical protein KNAG_0A02270 [Kazachstania naganishii CBS 8797]
MPIDQAKLAKLQKLSSTRKVGGTRRKQTKKVGEPVVDAKLSEHLLKLDAVPLQGIEEANLFFENGNVLNFQPVEKVECAADYNVSMIHGKPSTKKLDDILQEVVPQLGPEAYFALNQLDVKIKEFEEEKKNNNKKVTEL